MCYTCGCKLPYDDLGDPNNLVEEHFRKAGDTETINRAGIVAAKLNMLELLEIERDRGELEHPQESYNE